MYIGLRLALGEPRLIGRFFMIDDEFCSESQSILYAGFSFCSLQVTDYQSVISSDILLVDDQVWGPNIDSIRAGIG